MSIEPYKVQVSDSQLEQLRQRLSLTSFPDELDEAAWDLGSPLADVKRLASYWKDGYDWRKAEERINTLPQFTTTIQAENFEPLKIHFVHHRSQVGTAIPLLFVHGWPGSFLEVEKILPLLADGDGNATPAFHIVAPSIPGYGFSEATKKRGFGLAQYAETCHKLMQKLGYVDYVTQGGDWGSIITRYMGHLYPKHCKANHINLIMGSKPSFLKNPILALQHLLTPYSDRDVKGLARSKWFAEEGSGYRHEQSTKPQTLGYAMADSPVGLLAWIYEKLHDWTDNYPWTDDEILTWVSIYQFSIAGPAANLRIYYEALHSNKGAESAFRRYVPHVKLGLAFFPKELSVVPYSWAKAQGEVVYVSDNPHGGHFAATEHPGVIANDLQKMFGKGGGAYSVVTGKDGYSKVSARL